MPTIDELAAKYSGDGQSVVQNGTGDHAIDALVDKYSNMPSVVGTLDTKPEKSLGENLIGGLKQGFNSVINTGAQGIGLIDRTINGDKGAARSADFDQRLKSSNEDYEKNFGDSNVALGGKLIAQTAMTAPLIPARAIQAINIGAKALPTVLATGEKVAAPIVNRGLAAMGTGATGGAAFGGATSSENDAGLASNVGQGLITGAIAGPVVQAAAGSASKLLDATRSLWGNVSIDQLARSTGMSGSAVKNIVGRLEDAGYTPQTAQAELTRLGPTATLADLDKSLTTEASGLAALGGKPTAILKNRFDARAATANDNAKQIMETNLGTKPNLENEETNIVNQARTATKSDYDAAHASTDNIDVSHVVDNIDKQLVNAVGYKEGVLKKVKGYLFKTVPDTEGEEGATKTVLKNDVSSLHEVRQGIDDIINKRSDSLPGNANRAVNQVRDQIDTALKTNPQMQAADEKFAEKMKVKDALHYGNEALKNKTTIDDFTKTFGNATPEAQEAIRKGLRINIGDTLDAGARGELAGAQQLFGKKSVNRKILQQAFGPKADAVLDALQKQAAQRATENAVTQGSQTAERLAVQSRYGGGGGGGGLLREIGKGLAIDASTGSLGGATAINIAKTGGRHGLIKLGDKRLENLVAGSADLLSRQGVPRDIALDVMNKSSLVQTRIKNTALYHAANRSTKLPIALTGPVGEENYKQIRNR